MNYLPEWPTNLSQVHDVLHLSAILHVIVYSEAKYTMLMHAV